MGYLEIAKNNPNRCKLIDCNNKDINSIKEIVLDIVSSILKIPVYDTQCGAKLFRTEHAELIFSKPFLSRWYFDVELFSRSIELMGRQKTVNSIYEMPLSKWHDKGKSKVTWGSIIRTPVDLFRIFYHYRHRITNSPQSDST